MRLGKEPHTCIAKDVERFRVSFEGQSDHVLGSKMKGWSEFERPMYDLNRVWRLYVGMARREAFRRGIWAP